MIHPPPSPNIITETGVIHNGTLERLPVCSPLSNSRHLSAVPDTDYIALPWRWQAQGKRQTRVADAVSVDRYGRTCRQAQAGDVPRGLIQWVGLYLGCRATEGQDAVLTRLFPSTPANVFLNKHRSVVAKSAGAYPTPCLTGIVIIQVIPVNVMDLETSGQEHVMRPFPDNMRTQNGSILVSIRMTRTGNTVAWLTMPRVGSTQGVTMFRRNRFAPLSGVPIGVADTTTGVRHTTGLDCPMALTPTLGIIRPQPICDLARASGIESEIAGALSGQGLAQRNELSHRTFTIPRDTRWQTTGHPNLLPKNPDDPRYQSREGFTTVVISGCRLGRTPWSQRQRTEIVRAEGIHRKTEERDRVLTVDILLTNKTTLDDGEGRGSYESQNSDLCRQWVGGVDAPPRVSQLAHWQSAQISLSELVPTVLSDASGDFKEVHEMMTTRAEDHNPTVSEDRITPDITGRESRDR